MYIRRYACVCKYIFRAIRMFLFAKLNITAQSDLVLLLLMCYSHPPAINQQLSSRKCLVGCVEGDTLSTAPLKPPNALRFSLEFLVAIVH